MTVPAKTDNRPITEEGDFLQIKAVDHIHFWVGNAKHAMYYWWKGFGFTPVAYSGLETGNRQFASYVLQAGQARFVVSAPYAPSSEIAAHHLVHGDGVKIIALEVDDVEKAWKETTARGGKSAWGPREERDADGIFRTAAIHTYGETLHVFVDRSDYGGVFAPTYRPIKNGVETLQSVETLQCNVSTGCEMQQPYGAHAKVDMMVWKTADSAALSNGGGGVGKSPALAERRTNATLTQALVLGRIVE